MGIHLNLLTIDANITHWPDTKMKKCTCLGSDNKKYVADLLPSETELVLELKRLKSKLTQWELESLIKKIDNYADEIYDEGVISESISNEDI